MGLGRLEKRTNAGAACSVIDLLRIQFARTIKALKIQDLVGEGFLFSVFCFAAAVWDKIAPGATGRQLDADRIPSSLLLAVSALLGLVSLVALFGVIFGITVISPS
jgi:hypothetical protein